MVFLVDRNATNFCVTRINVFSINQWPLGEKTQQGLDIEKSSLYYNLLHDWGD